MRAFLTLTTATLILAACGDPAPAAAQKSAAAKPVGGLTLDASGAPRLKPGLYKLIEDEGDGEPRTVHECIGEEANAQVREMLAKKSTPECKVASSSSASGLQVSSDCLQHGLRTQLKLAMTGTYESYKATLDLSVTTKDGKTSAARSTVEARWIGACPAGLAPGESLEDQEDDEDH